MNLRRPFGRVIKVGLIALLLIVCLGSESLHRAALSWPSLNQIQAEFFATFRTPDLQWLILVCMSVYLIGFIWLLRPLKRARLFWGDNSVIQGVVLYALGVLVYAWNYDQASRSIDAFIFFFGITLFFGFRFWRAVETKRSRPFKLASVVLGFTLICLSIGAVWCPESFQSFQYRGQPRWSGLWDNPNTFGMLMAVGVVMTTGQILSLVTRHLSCSGIERARHLTSAFPPNEAEGESGTSAAWRWIMILVFGVMGVSCGVGLVKSYSRGAWVATLCGLAFMAWSVLECGGVTPLWTRRVAAGESCAESQHSKVAVWLGRNWLPTSVILISVLVVSFWNYRHTERVVVRRAFSVSQVNDFSWRNRVAAWVGALQMIADKPLLGFGWNQSEHIYDEFYRASKVDEGMAIQMNDYFTLGTTLGVPALICFVAFVIAALCRVVGEDRRETPELAAIASPVTRHLSLSTVCRAGATVLLVGFWFDGGLFKLALGAVFWILLELGDVRFEESPRVLISAPV